MPAPTAPTRDSLIVGIGKISRPVGSLTYTTQDETEFAIRLREKLSDVKIGGQTIDKRWIEYTAELTFNPDGRMRPPAPNAAAATDLFWNAYANFLPGASIFTTSDIATTVTGSDGAVHSLKCTAVTGMPSLRLHPERGAIGPCTITGIIAEAKNWTDSDAFYEVTGSGTFTDSTWTPSDVLRQQYSAAYGAVPGLTDFQGIDGFTVDFRLTTSPIVVQGITRDMKFTSLEVMVRCQPTTATTANILAALKVDAASAGLTGRSLFSGANSLTITGADGTAILTIPKATIYTGEFNFSGQRLRVGEVAFYACRNYSSGAQAALYTVA